MKTIKNSRQGFTLVEIMIVVAIIGLLAAIAIPNFVRARETAQTNSCINNLRQIDGAKQQWALETSQKSDATPVAADIEVYLGRTGSVSNLFCPAAGTNNTFAASYTINAVNAAPTCKIVTATHVLD